MVCSACSSRDDGNPSHSFRVFTENGISIAEDVGGPKYQGEIFEYEKVLELRFNPENEESLLIRPWMFIMDEDGYFYVADAGNHRIAVFNPEGLFERGIGREGEGPGDLFDPTRVFLHNDTLIIPDSPRGRTSLFRTDGTFIDVLSYPLAGYRLRRLDRTESGNLILHISQQVQDTQKMQFGERVVSVSPEGDTLAVLDSPLVTLAKMVNAEVRVFIQSTQSYAQRTRPTQSFLHYTGYGQATYSPEKEQVLISSGEEPYIDWYNLHGELVSRIHLVLPEQIVTKEEKDEIIAAYDRQIEEAAAEPDERRQEIGIDRARTQRKIVQLPDKKSYWIGVSIDTDGYYWLGHPQTQRIDYDSDRSIKSRLLSPEGEYLGDTTWPASETGGNVCHGYLLIVCVDKETDEQIPTVYRIRSLINGLAYPN